ncbi:two-component system response regulator TorR [Photobacterium chitinilyticum]|uniref:Two-component system response regulator TorR n=1 Tax=Photobacterium chitinilyticum TaxID=2485123 RepID=A0A444JP27_9GAMM|nr:two-component system response regulator TorR [Photobacterium chitinilyticum]RWX54817.1 two-component system response regulator TorR [Photobacterium chitinilyticum]
MNYQILIVEDDPILRMKIKGHFAQAGYAIFEADNGAVMKEILSNEKIDLILLDINLPGEDGIQLTREVRNTSDIAIIMVTGRIDPIDRILGLEMGADDYVTKPVEPRELLVRAKNLLWRIQLTRDALQQAEAAWSQLEKDDSRFCFKDFEFDVAQRQLSKGSEAIKLTKAEYELLVAFITHPSRVLSRGRLLNLISHRVDAPSDRTIDVLVRRLRNKMEDNIKNPKIFITVHGEGYLFAPEVV